jgi:prepilin peptidase CpaA
MVEVLSMVCVVVYLGGLVAAAGWDLICHTIPNAVVAAVALAAATALALAAPNPAMAVDHVATALGILAVGAALFAAGLWGAGDAKLLAAEALAVGPAGIAGLIFWTAIIGGGLSVIIMVLRHIPIQEKINSNRWIDRLYQDNNNVPYGIAISTAGIIAFIDNHSVFSTVNFGF